MRDRPIVIYEGNRRPSEESDLLAFAVLPAIGAGVMWTFWLQQEVILVWTHPFEHLGYTAIITALGAAVLAAILIFVALVALSIFALLRSSLRFTMRVFTSVRMRFAFLGRMILRTFKKVTK